MAKSGGCFARGSRESKHGHNPNHVMIRKFLRSAAEYLEPNGQVMISAVGSPHYEGIFKFDEGIPIEIGLVGPTTLKQKYDYAQICGIDGLLDVVKKMRLGTAVNMIMNSKPDATILTLSQSENMQGCTLRFSSIGQLRKIWEEYILPIQSKNFQIHPTITGGYIFDID